MDKFVMMGNGKVIHKVRRFLDSEGNVIQVKTRCEGVNTYTDKTVMVQSDLRYVEATEATCKRCLK